MGIITKLLLTTICGAWLQLNLIASPLPTPPRDSRILADTTTSKNKLQPVVRLSDSFITSVTEIPKKFISQADQKITKYSSRLSSKTEKTLIKLSKWEEKLKPIIEKANPQTAKQLFGPGKVTFSSLLQKLQEGKNLVKKVKAPYDAYRDKLVTSLAYIQSEKEKFTKPYMDAVDKARQNAGELEQNLANTEAVEKFINQRKKELLDQCIKYAIKSRYLKKINKEAYYYVETIRNYKELFSDPKKAEQTAKEILKKIPAFKKFFSQNSMLASLFGIGSQSSNGAVALNGLQTRMGVNNLIQSNFNGSSATAQQYLSGQMASAQSRLGQLKLKFPKGYNSNEPAGFKPNTQRSKTFWQRVEYGFNYQFTKTSVYLPNAIDMAFTAGYKLSDKSVVGIGINYKLGWGSLQKIKISHQGIGLRAYLDWKMKGQFYLSGSVELNRNDGFKHVSELRNYRLWQTAGLVGISRKLNLSAGIAKATKVQILYNIFYKNTTPVSKPFVFRLGYEF